MNKPLHLLEGLNPGQREAVQTVEGPLLVHAGPGSGKTRVIVHRIAWMVLEARINPRHILAVTFSKKAAGEMKKRLYALLGKTASSVTVSTIHAACLRILRREGIPGLGMDFDICDDEEQAKLIKECMDKAGLDFAENDLRRFKAVISYGKTNLIDLDSIVPRAGERFDDATAAVYRNYQRTLKRQRKVDYDDMLVSTHRLFLENENALKKYQHLYRYILVDEFQDTSSLQYRIIRMLGARHGNVCVVGDPDQTIYSWRQAEIRNTDNFRKDFPGARVIGMVENYRSTGNIVEAANNLISHNSRRMEKLLFTSRERGAKIEVVKLEDEEDEAIFIAGTIKWMASERGLKYGDFAVLYRINAQSRALEDQFNLKKVPYRLPGGTPFYKRMEIIDLTAWLRVMRNPGDDSAMLRVISIAGKGLGAQSVAVMQAHALKNGTHLYRALEMAAAGNLSGLPVRTQRRAAQFLAMVQGLRAESRHVSLAKLMNIIIDRTAYRDHLKGESNPDERWENVLELMAMASPYEHLSPLNALSELLDRISTASEAAERGENADCVTLNTLHGSKGTEFPVVFIAGTEEGLLPHSKSLDNPDQMEEERRLCYVGITRAMDLVYLTYTQKRHVCGDTSLRVPSRFLYELPARLISKRVASRQPKP